MQGIALHEPLNITTEPKVDQRVTGGNNFIRAYCWHTRKYSTQIQREKWEILNL